jgi:uncharacterized protein YbjT (DUF2867 family)
MTRRVLVTGATGNQGGAVIDALVAADSEFEVYGLTRDRSGDTAVALTQRGVRMVEGDLYKPSSLRPHVEAVDAVFAVTNFWTAGYDGQVEQGTNLATVAAETGVDQFVLSGAGGHHRETGVPQFDSVAEIERHARQQDLPLTVLQPTFFFQNLEAFRAGLSSGRLAWPLDEGTTLQMVDIHDVGRAAAAALERPEQFVGGRYELAGDELTLSDIAAAVAETTSIDVEPQYLSVATARERFGDEFAEMFAWFNETGYGADIAGLSEVFGFEFGGLETYLRTHGWQDTQGMTVVPGWVKGLD